jgi:hypothetical protein
MNMDTPVTRTRLCAIGATLTVLAYLAIFAGDGIFAYFTPDDMMNLYFAWFRPPLHIDRPLGALFYRGLFAAFGENPMPYRIVCFGLLLANLALLYVFCARLSRSREIAALACLLGAYHAHLADIYYSTGTLYDLLCGVFLMGAFVYYTGIRERGQSPRWTQVSIFLVLYLAALGAKEMAVMLPAFVLAYELVCVERASRSARATLRVLVPAAVVTILVLIFKVAGPGKMLENSSYRPHLAWSTFTEAWEHYAFDLFYGKIVFNQVRLLVLWTLMLAIACFVRRRTLLFAFLFLFLGILPVAFISPRGFFAIYLTLPGWYLFIATTLVAARDALIRALRVPAALAPQVALFVAVAIVLFPLHRRQKPRGKQWVAEAHATVRSVVEPLPRVAGSLPRGARVLFLSDPFPKDEWMLTFIFRLHYRDEEIRVDRALAMHTYPDRAAQATYDRLFRLDGGILTQAANIP